MKIPKKKLGNNMIPFLGLGTYRLKGEECVETVKKALDMGYRHVDTAEIYGNQEEIGTAIEKSSVDREDLFITSKVWHTNLRYKEVLKACNETLDELGTEYLDLYLVHWPNPDVSIRETMMAMEELYKQGKIKAMGVSNFAIKHLEEAMEETDIPITMNQVEFHPFLYQKELLKFCKENDISMTAYCPIARNKVAENEKIKEIAEKHGKTPAQVSLKWLLHHGLIAIPKSSSEEHLKENMEIFDFNLDREDMEKIDSLPQKRLIEPDFADFD